MRGVREGAPIWLALGTRSTRSLRMVRTWARWLLVDLTADQQVDALLVLDELVSNACQHGHPPFGVRLQRLAGAGCFRIEVDDGAAAEPRVRAAPVTGLNGRGMRIVNTLAGSWGVRRRDRGKTVWAEVSLTTEPGTD